MIRKTGPAPEHKSAPVEPQKAHDTQMVSHASNHRRLWQLHNPLQPLEVEQQIQPIPLAIVSNAREQLDVAPGLEELEMGDITRTG